MQDSSGEITTSTYNGQGKIATMTENPGTPEEETSIFTYDDLGREDYVDYGNGVWVDYSYEGAGADWTTLEASTIGKIERKFNDDGSLGGWVTPGGEEITFEYNNTGQLEKEITPGGTTIYNYDSLGRVISVLDETTGVETITHYDEHYLVNGYEDPDSKDDHLIGRVAAREIALHDAENTRYISHYTYHADGQIKTSTDAKGATWHYDYSDTTVTITDPLGRKTTTARTAEYLPSETHYADGTSTSVEHLFSNNLLEGSDYPTLITDRAERDRDFTYDENGRLASATDWGETTYTYHYNENGFDYSVRNPNGETVLGYNYSDDGELDTVTYLDNSQRTFVYNSTDNTLQQETLPSGETIDYTYDSESGLETKRTYSRDGEFLYEVISNWDKETGQLKTVTDPTGTTTYHYDPDTGDFSGLDYPNNSSIRYQRDILGRVEKITVKPNKDGSAEYITEYEYDANGNIEKVTDPNNKATILIYDKVNRLEERTLPNGIKTVYTYKENTDFIEKITHYAPDGVTVISSVEYERSDSGEPTKITHEDGSYVLLKYDESLRLEKETYDGQTLSDWADLEPGPTGGIFEDFLQDNLCNLLPNFLGERLWLTPEVKDNGIITDPGFNCITRGRKKINSFSNPDFLFEDGNPKPVQKNNPKSYLIGDVKLTLTQALDTMEAAPKKKQWPAMAKHAKLYQGLPFTSYVTFKWTVNRKFKQDPNYVTTTLKDMQKRAIDDGVVLFIVNIFG